MSKIDYRNYFEHQTYKIMKEFDELEEPGRECLNTNSHLLDNIICRLREFETTLRELYRLDFIKMKENETQRKKEEGLIPEKARYDFNSTAHKINYICKILINRELIRNEDKRGITPLLLTGVSEGIDIDDVRFFAQNCANIEDFMGCLKEGKNVQRT